MKYIENSLENKCTDARVWRVNMPPATFLDLKLGWVLNACSSKDYGTETSLFHILIWLLLGLAKKKKKKKKSKQTNNNFLESAPREKQAPV